MSPASHILIAGCHSVPGPQNHRAPVPLAKNVAHRHGARSAQHEPSGQVAGSRNPVTHPACFPNWWTGMEFRSDGRPCTQLSDSRSAACVALCAGASVTEIFLLRRRPILRLAN